MKSYRLHRCERRHRSYRAFAQCVWPRYYVDGEGPYALVNDCRPREVALYESKSDARKQKKLDDEVGCCGGCGRQHRVIHLDLPSPPDSESG